MQPKQATGIRYPARKMSLKNLFKECCTRIFEYLKVTEEKVFKIYGIFKNGITRQAQKHPCSSQSDKMS